MLSVLKKINKYINNLWHSKNEDCKYTGIGGILIFVTSLLIFLIAWKLDDSNNILYTGFKIFLFYLWVAFAYISLILIFTYFYVYGILKNPCSCRFLEYLTKFIYKMFLVIGVIVEIPFLFLLKLIETIINYRAKKIDNIINLSSILVLNFIVISALYKLIWILAYFLAEKLSLIINIFELNQIFVFFLFLLILIKLLTDIVSCLIFIFLKTKITRDLKNRMYKMKLDLDNEIFSLDIREHIEKKSKILEERQLYSSKMLEYDLDYHKKSIWKMQLVFLIIIYVFASIVDNKELVVVASEVKDAATTITLFMLFWDKRKDWK